MTPNRRAELRRWAATPPYETDCVQCGQCYDCAQRAEMVELLDEIGAAESRLAELEAVVAWYGDLCNWAAWNAASGKSYRPAHHDQGTRARAALVSSGIPPPIAGNGA